MEDEPVEIPIEDTLDLHSFRPNEIRDLTREYLEEARRRGFRQVRLIHGRGIGVQRETVQSLLRTLDLRLSRTVSAPIDHFSRYAIAY